MTAPTTPFSEPKKARRKVTTDLGRQLLQKERQRLSREQAALGEQLAEEALRKMAAQHAVAHTAKPEQIAVSRGIVRRFAAVLASEGLNVRITAQPVGRMSAWTDFEQIYIGYRQHDDVRLLAATMRGLAYHEGGHCRFTLPFMQLVEAVGLQGHHEFHKAWNVLEDQRMETAVTSDSPRKAAYITTTVMTELLDTVSAAADNYPLIIWRRYLSKKIRRGARKLFVFKHNAMGIDGEQLAKDWERVVTQYVLADNAQTMWNAVVEAHGLLQITRGITGLDDAAMGHDRQRKDDSKRDLSDALVIPVAPSMLQEDGGDDLLDYDDEEAEIDFTDPENAEHMTEVLIALWNSPETLITVIFGMSGGADSEPVPGEPTPQGEQDDDDDSESDDEGSESGDSDEDSNDDDSESAEGDSDGDEPDGEEDEEADEHSDDDATGESNSDSDDDEEGSGSSHKSDADHTPDNEDDEDDDDDLTDADLNQAREEAEEERDNDPALDGDVDAFHDAIENQASHLLPYETGVSADLQSAAAAENLATEIELAFQAATMDSSPAWVEQQRRGVLNVMRYKTRQPGDVEFFRAWADDDQPGFNISVSVMLDYSASMGGSVGALAEAGYATKLACQKLDIPCTVTLWDSGATVLWDAIEKAENLPIIKAVGSTDPTVALADLINQRYEKAQHLVIIMTDGEWNGNAAKPGYLATYKEEGRVIIGLGYSNGGYAPADMGEKLRRYGCDEGYTITNLMDIPRQLESTLIALA